LKNRAFVIAQLYLSYRTLFTFDGRTDETAAVYGLINDISKWPVVGGDYTKSWWWPSFWTWLIK